MPLGGFGLISIFYIFLGIRFVYQLIPRRKQVFDKNYTQQDRSTVAQAAFFILLPVSVLLHELGHAAAIWLMGGRVLGYGYYFFAGYVSYDPRLFSDTQQWIIAFAGTLVNVVLIVIALWWALYRQPPLRAAYTDLLIQFSFISGINALIVYPLLDLASNLNGDWRQMYSSGIPALTGLIIIIQGIAIFAGYQLFRTEKWQRKIADRTAGPVTRTVSHTPRPATAQSIDDFPFPASVSNAIERVSSGWPSQIQLLPVPKAQRPAVALLWKSHNEPHGLILTGEENGPFSIIKPEQTSNGVTYQPMQQWASLPNENDLTMSLRKAMELVSAT